MKSKWRGLLSIIITLIFMGFAVSSAQSATSIDTISFKPAADQGYYLTVEQSQTLGKWGYALGLTTEYSKGSAVAVNAAGVKIRDVINNQIAMQLGSSLGLFDWLNVGLNITAVPYQQFNTVVAGTPDNGFRMGDIRLNFKGRILDHTRYPIGLAIVPFMTFPTGNDDHFVGNGKFTGGALLVMETPRFADRFSAALNVGFQGRESATLSSGTKVGSRFLIGSALNVALIKSLHLIAEMSGWTPFSSFWKENSRNLEFNGAVRWQPPVDGLSVTAGAGTGIYNAIGAPDYRTFLTISYRNTNLKKGQKALNEVTIQTNMIHFAFDRSRILPASHPVLDKVASVIVAHPQIIKIEVEGHTDSIGSVKYNDKLSQRRAKAVTDYLIKKGVTAKLITSIGKGKGDPIADNKTKDGRAKNRRVEFHLVFPEGSKIKIKEGQDSPTFLE